MNTTTLVYVIVSNGRDIRKGKAGIGAGLEGSLFSFEETCLVLNLRCEREIEGRLQSELWTR